MDAVMGEAAEGNKEECNSVSETGGTRINGEVNGSMEEAMEVCEVPRHDPLALKKVASDVLSESVDESSNHSVSDIVNCDVNGGTEREVPISEPSRKQSDSVAELPAGEEMDVEEHNPIVGNDAIEAEVRDEKDKEKLEDGEGTGRNEESSVLSEKHKDALSESNTSQTHEISVVFKNEENSDTPGQSNQRSIGERKEISNSSKMEVDKELDRSVVDSDSLRDKTHNITEVESDNLEVLPDDDPLGEVNDDGNERDPLSCKTDVSSSCDKVDEKSEKSMEKSKSDDEEKPNAKSSLSSSPVEAGCDTSQPDKDSDEVNDSAAKKDKKLEEKDEADTSSSDPKVGESPGKVKKARKSVTPLNLTPRRSSRNLNKQKSYAEKEEDPDIQEITPVDPLADSGPADPLRDDKENTKVRNVRKNTIVVNDTKRLVEIAAGSKGLKGGKKEPTLVIIDTNSILSGRGPVPVSQGGPAPGPSSSSQGFSVLPVALPAQGMYPPMRPSGPPPQAPPPPPATVTPVLPVPIVRPPPPPPPPQILPSLTDDMYVVEAPSFIVPYVYEKPPNKPLKEFIDKLDKDIKEMKEKEELTHKLAAEKAALVKKEDIKEPGADEAMETEKEKMETEKVDHKENRSIIEKDEAQKDDVKSAESDKKVEETSPDNSKDETKKIDVEPEKNVAEIESVQAKEDSEKSKEGPKEISGVEIKCNEDKADKTSESAAAPASTEERGEAKTDSEKEKSNKVPTYFDNPLGKFFSQIGVNLVQEYVQTELLRTQKRKREREGGQGNANTQFAINSLVKNLELSKENNEPFHLEQKKCEYCSFKTESTLVMAQHLETPHMRNYVYRCNFCPLEVRSPHDILFHMEAEHNVRGRLERAPAFHQCPNCPFEDNQKGKLTRHLMSCTKKHKPEKNQEPPPDWEPPAKIPRIARSRPTALGLGAAAYQAMAANKNAPHPLLPKLIPGSTMSAPPNPMGRGRGRPPIHNRYLPQDLKVPQRPIAPTQIRQNMMYRAGGPTSQPQVLLPATYQIAGSQIYQSAANNKNPAAKLLQQPSISITPLPRQPTGMPPNPMHTKHTGQAGLPGHPSNSAQKASFVICEICDGYIKDLEQLRNHMQWIHKVKIHPKMIYNRPPLNCQKCQFRFFTDQGLERHLLGSHGLVTSSMQEAANKGKDGGRCPVCGRVYQWKLLNHVARDHNMSLKPAHLSYKCTVCTATFGMYKQFENHVYSAHSVVAKRVMDKKSPQTPRPQSNETILKPLKINDEITIIPQPARPRPGPASKTGAVSASMQASLGKVWYCERCEHTFDGQTGFTQYLAHIKRRHLRRCNVKVCRLEECPTCKKLHCTEDILDYIEDNKSGVDVIELSDDEVITTAGQGRNEITITKVPCAPGPKRFKQKLMLRAQRAAAAAAAAAANATKVQVIELEDSPIKNKNSEASATRENGEDSLNAVKERLRRRKSLEISQVDSEGSPQSGDDSTAKKRHRNDD